MSVAIRTRGKAFKVASVSSNTNSFGLTGMILIARDGEAWQVGANSISVRAKGTIIKVPKLGTARTFAALSFELPERLPDAPPGVVAEIWNTKETR
jgi:hypothetical protein